MPSALSEAEASLDGRDSFESPTAGTATVNGVSVLTDVDTSADALPDDAAENGSPLLSDVVDEEDGADSPVMSAVASEIDDGPSDG